jgi:hypothetical protein
MEARPSIMQKIAFILSSLLLFCLRGAAQVPNGNVFFGYSFFNTDLSSVDRANANGWEASIEGKIIPFLGFVADFDQHYGSQNFPGSCPGPLLCLITPVNDSFTETNFLFGPRVSVPVGKFRPFAEALFGGAHVNVNSVGSDTSFATAIGGGLDYKIIRPIAWRVEGDYVRTSFFGATQNNVRISTGIVLRF